MFDDKKFDTVRERHPILLQLYFFVLTMVFSFTMFLSGILLMAIKQCETLTLGGTTQKVCQRRDVSAPLFMFFIGIFVPIFYLYVIFSEQLNGKSAAKKQEQVFIPEVETVEMEQTIQPQQQQTNNNYDDEQYENLQEANVQ